MEKYLVKIEKNIYEIKSNKNKIYLRSGTSDFEVLKDIWGERTYNFNLRNEPKVILDCGANSRTRNFIF